MFFLLGIVSNSIIFNCRFFGLFGWLLIFLFFLLFIIRFLNYLILFDLGGFLWFQIIQINFFNNKIKQILSKIIFNFFTCVFRISFVWSFLSYVFLNILIIHLSKSLFSLILKLIEILFHWNLLFIFWGLIIKLQSFIEILESQLVKIKIFQVELTPQKNCVHSFRVNHDSHVEIHQAFLTFMKIGQCLGSMHQCMKFYLVIQSVCQVFYGW